MPPQRAGCSWFGSAHVWFKGGPESSLLPAMGKDLADISNASFTLRGVMLKAFPSLLSAVANSGCSVALLLFFFCTPVPESRCTAGADGWKPSVLPYEDVSLSDGEALPSVLCELLRATSSVMGRGTAAFRKQAFFPPLGGLDMSLSKNKENSWAF